MRAAVIGLVLCWAVPAHAQFALDIGNRWEFVTILDPPHAPPDTVGAGVLEVLGHANGYALLSEPVAGADSVRLVDRQLLGLLDGQEHLLLDFGAGSGARYTVPLRGGQDTLDVVVEVGRERKFQGGFDVLETPAGYFDAAFTFTATPRRTLDAGWQLTFSPTQGPVARMDGQGTLGLLAHARTGGEDLAHFHVELTTDKAHYAPGEPIILTLFVRNDSGRTVRLGTFCNAPSYVVGAIAPRFEACILWVDYHEFKPGSNRSWTWRHDPRIMGMPDGQTHRFTAFFEHVGASVTVQAPEYEGGWLRAEIAHFLPESTEEAIRTDLRAQVLESTPGSDGGRSEVWALTEVSIEEAMRRHGAQTGLALEDMRLMHLTDLTSTRLGSRAHPQKAFLDVYPNPVQEGPLHFDGLLPGEKLEVFDLLGRRVATAGPVLDTGSLAPGIYLYRGERHTGTFVITR